MRVSATKTITIATTTAPEREQINECICGVFLNKNSEVSYQPISVDCGNRKSFLIFSISVTWQVKSCKRKRAKNFSLVAKKSK